MIQQIPKRLIQTGKTRQLPLLAQASAANLQLLNPGFEYLFFDDQDVEDFVDTYFPQYRPLFDSFPYRIQKYDFFRYLAIYHYGGFYFDLDIMLARGLDDLCHSGCVFPFEELSLHSFLRDSYGMDWEVGNYAFGAAPGHPFIAAVIDNCVRAQRDVVWSAAMWRSIPSLFRREFYVLDTTGPGLVSRTLAEFSDASSHVHVLFPTDVCDQSHWHQFGHYGVHLQDGGWRERKGFWRRRLGSIWETRVRATSLAQAMHRGPARSLSFVRRESA
jgi:inositol phosphorylceramide mannosyltransferase catalytic subunit